MRNIFHRVGIELHGFEQRMSLASRESRATRPGSFAFSFCLALASLFFPTAALIGTAQATPPANHATCSTVPASAPQVVKDFVALQCQLHATIFADGTEPSVSYVLAEEPNEGSVMTGLSPNGHSIEFSAVEFHANKHQDDGSANYPQALNGQMTYSLVGTIIGSAGKERVFAICFNEQLQGPIGQDRWLIIVTKIVDAETLDIFAQKNRILAGVRVMSLLTLQSAPLKDVDVEGQALVANVSDLGTMMTPNALLLDTTTQQPSPGSQEACVAAAYAQYNIMLDLASDILKIGLLAVTALFVLAMAACAAIAIGTAFVGFLGAAVCAGLALGEQIIGSAAVVAAYQVTVNAANRSLRAALAACGVFLVDV